MKLSDHEGITQSQLSVAGLGVDAPKYLSGSFPKRCGCGREYSQPTWKDLPLCGVWPGVIEGRRFGPDLELRNCSCRSTISVAVSEVSHG